MRLEEKRNKKQARQAYDDHKTARGEASSCVRKEKIMRLDKYLKVSRLIKRRTVANEACDAGRVLINDKVAKASAEVKVNDKIEIQFGTRNVVVRVTSIAETVKKDEAKEMYEYI